MNIATNRCCKPFSCATLVVIVWSVLINAGIYIIFNVILLFQVQNEVRTGFTISSTMSLLVPTLAAGVLMQRFGLYRVITASAQVSMVAVLVILCAFVMLQFNCTLVPGIVLMFIALPVCMAGMACGLVCSLPFIIDQMTVIGASSENIGAAVQWFCWGLAAMTLASDLLHCLPLVIVETQLENMHPVLLLTILVLSLSTVLITDCLWHKSLEVHYRGSNGIKTLFRVLNYARKTKYPERRSAFTYIDEEAPSRLDYGKHKFGGPFTEEEVENVKTVLRLLLLFFPVILCGLVGIGNNNNQMNLLYIHLIQTTTSTHNCVKTLSNLLNDVFFFLLIPTYRFIFFPLLRNRLPSQLKILGAGLCLCFISTLVNFSLDTVGHLHSNTTSCMFDTLPPWSANTLPVPIYWLLISNIVNSAGVAIVTCTLLEFVLAQIPIGGRVTTMAIVIFLVNVGTVIQIGTAGILSKFNMSKATPSCGFYYYLVMSILQILSLVLFTIAAKRYKLRERERHVNIQAIAEEHYERYFDQEEEYMREAANIHRPQIVDVN